MTINRIYKTHRLASASGIFMPISAIVAVVLVAALLLLGVNTTVVRRASHELRRHADGICETIASGDITFQAQAALQFRDLVHALPRMPGRIRLVRATLIAPTMPYTMPEGDFDLANPDTGLDPHNVDAFLEVNGTSFDALRGGQRISFTVLGIPCDGSDLEDCFLQHHLFWLEDDEADPEIPEGYVHRRYPAHLWNNFDNAGNTIGCELEAEVDMLLSPAPHAVYGRAVAWKPVIGGAPNYIPYSHGQDGQDGVAPGLTIAIATHLTTDANRLSLPNAVPDTFWDVARKAIYDPLAHLAPLNIPTFHSAPLDVDHQAHRMVDAQHYIVAPEDVTQPNELAIACVNPAVLVRNIFLSTIVELASRNGQLRSTTEILHIGTQHRDSTRVPTVNDVPSGGNVNGPTQIVPFGSDLTASDYQLPYISYHSGDAANPSVFGDSRGGVIDPVEALAGAPTPLKQHHALLAGQLRYCYHLYRGSAASGIERFPLAFDEYFPVGIGEQLNQLESRPTLFEDSAIYASPFFFSDNGNYMLGTANGFWDQHCPYDLPGCAGNAPDYARLPAADLVSILGSAQTCPAQSNNNGGNSFCSKPVNSTADIGTKDLRPDILGFLGYVAGGAEAGFSSPGGAAPMTSPVTAANSNTPLLIITHQRLTSLGGINLIPDPPVPFAGSSEVKEIRDKVDLIGRPILVVYFPTTDLDTSNVALQNLKYAFDAGSEDAPNRLIVFSPFNSKYVSDGRYSAFVAPDDMLSAYWMDLLNPDSDINITATATAVYNSLLQLQRKF